MTDVFVSWSGGKDSAYALYKACQRGLKVRSLLNMVVEDGSKSWSHNLPGSYLQLQAKAMGIPIIQCRTTQANYETAFRDTLLGLKKDGITGGVFGDIDFEPHGEWVKRICGDAGMMSYLPLWGLPQVEIIRDFIKLKFEAVVVVAKAEFFEADILKKKIDSDMLACFKRLHRTKGLTVCGEAGEYHTFVVNGPIFKHAISLRRTSTFFKDGYWFLDIGECELKEK